eukprot:scaffold5771_cov171-Amphora_coffeaeformis.AAC.16
MSTLTVMVLEDRRLPSTSTSNHIGASAHLLVGPLGRLLEGTNTQRLFHPYHSKFFRRITTLDLCRSTPVLDLYVLVLFYRTYTLSSVLNRVGKH